MIEETTKVMLARSEHAEAAARLTKLVRDYPLQERFAGQLMLAQYRCGRQADAPADVDTFIGRSAELGEPDR